jgi:hypothetical protein
MQAKSFSLAIILTGAVISVFGCTGAAAAAQVSGNIKSDSHSSVLSHPDKPEPKGSGQPYQHECRCRN